MPMANQPKTMITLVKSLVLSRLYYGVEACYDMPASLITATEQAECRAIKLALGLPRATPRYLANREAGMLPAKLYLQFICTVSDRNTSNIYILIHQREEIGSKTYVRPTKPAKRKFFLWALIS